MPAALAAREAGLPLVNIAQPFKSSGMMLTCRNDFGRDLDRGLPRADARGLVLRQRVSVPELDGTLGIPTDGGPEGVTVLKQGFNVDPLLQKQAACISTMTYNEYWQVIDAGLAPEDLTVFKYEDQGVATLEDGLYVLEDRLADPAFVETMAKFVRASMKGWKWAEENPDDGGDDRARERRDRRADRGAPEADDGRDRQADRRLGRRARPGRLRAHGQDAAAAGSEPVITKAPEGAWTHAVTDKALAM